MLRNERFKLTCQPNIENLENEHKFQRLKTLVSGKFTWNFCVRVGFKFVDLNLKPKLIVMRQITLSKIEFVTPLNLIH